MLIFYVSVGCFVIDCTHSPQEAAMEDAHLMQYTWYVGAVTRSEAETLLSMSDEGTMLVRASGGDSALSGWYAGRITLLSER